jgi:hypothetical protein
LTRDLLSQLVSDTEKDDKQRQSRTENYTYNEQRYQNKTEIKDEFNEIKSDCIETNSTDQLEFQNETTENVQSEDTCDTTDIQDVKNSHNDNRIGSSDKVNDNCCEISSDFRDDVCMSSAVHKVEDKCSDILSNFTKPVCSKIQELKPKKKRESKKNKLHTPPMTTAVIHIEKCVYEWFTIESMCFLFGEEKTKEMVEEKGKCIKEYYKVVRNASWDPQMQEQYMAICRRLNIMEIEDREYDNQIATKPLPDYTAVREEAKKMDLKVRAYYQGKTVYEDDDRISISETHDNSAPILPLVDLHAQNALRRRIVLDHLNRT